MSTSTAIFYSIFIPLALAGNIYLWRGAWLGWSGIIQRRRADAMFMRLRSLARVLKVGTCQINGNHVHIEDWHFDCMGIVPVVQIAPCGKQLFFGYTKEELVEMYRRPSEFEQPYEL